jgi:hypothetical protein
MDRTGCETALEVFSRAVGELWRLALVAVVALTLAVTVAMLVSISAAFVAIVIIIAIVPSVSVLPVLVPPGVRAIVVRTVVAAVIVSAIVVRTGIPGVARADDRKVSVPVTTRALNDEIPIGISRLALIDRSTVAVVCNRIPASINASVSVVDAVGGVAARPAEDDIANAVRRA